MIIFSLTACFKYDNVILVTSNKYYIHQGGQIEIKTPKKSNLQSMAFEY